MAREAVANGSGALTKRTVERDDEQSAPPNQTVNVIPPGAPLTSDGQSDYDRGQDVLRQFREMDARDTQAADNYPAQTSTEQVQVVTPRLNHQEGHGTVYWLVTIILVAVASFIIAKKFLLTDKPALTKSQLFSDSSERLKAAVDKIEPAKPPPKIARPPAKKDDDKGKHFEIRV